MGAWARCPEVVQAHRIGRLCEEFPGVTPAAMWQELRTDPDQWAVQVLEVRAYARAKAAMERATKNDEIDRSDPVMQRVLKTQAAILRGEASCLGTGR